MQLRFKLRARALTPGPVDVCDLTADFSVEWSYKPVQAVHGCMYGGIWPQHGSCSRRNWVTSAMLGRTSTTRRVKASAPLNEV
jgi:hypothetical protein